MSWNLATYLHANGNRQGGQGLAAGVASAEGPPRLPVHCSSQSTAVIAHHTGQSALAQITNDFLLTNSENTYKVKENYESAMNMFLWKINKEEYVYIRNRMNIYKHLQIYHF